jgi:tRNA A-37 threonylcarbamoyl transferase component Bud32
MTEKGKIPEGFRRVLELRFEGYSWVMVKTSSKRSVYHLRKEGHPGVYLKVYHPEGLFQKVNNLISPRTKREADMLEKLAASGISAAEVLAHFRFGVCSAIAVREVENSRLLSSFETGFQEHILFLVTKDFLEHNFVHYDLHPGNILIDESSNYVLIDCYEVQKKCSVVASNWIRSFALAASVYGTTLPELKMLIPEEFESVLGAVSEMAGTIRRKRAARHIRRSLSEGSFSRIEINGDYRAIVRRYETPDLNEIINLHGKNLREGSNLLKVQEKTQVSIVGEYCVKSYNKSSVLLEPYALRSWKGSLVLMFNGFRVAEPVACIVFRDRSSMLISRKLDYPQLDRLLDCGGLVEAERKTLAGMIGRAIGRMHMSGIFHADLKACNIFIDTGRNEAVFIDTDRVVQSGRVSREKRFRNLMQIGLSIPRRSAISSGREMIDAYAVRTGDDADYLVGELKRQMKGKEVIYTTENGDRFEVF